MKTSYLTAGATLQTLLKILFNNRFSWRPKYLFRILFLLQGSIWSSVFAIYEKIKVGRMVKNAQAQADPIFIIGHWRTGSTFLHKLLSFDPQLYTPTLYDVAIPDSCMTSYRFYSPFMKLMVSKKRPMDNVALGIDEPQEDEYALYRLTGYSPLVRLIFPKEKGYFLNNSPSYLPEDATRYQWEKQLHLFFKKLSLKSGKQVVSKNPFNSMRIKELIQLFPNAKFIHITRNPLDVVPSTQHMFSIVQAQNILNTNYSPPSLEEVTLVYKAMLNQIKRDQKSLPSEQIYSIQFENLELNPVEEIRRLYAHLNLSFTQQFEQNLHAHLAAIKGYEKNRFELSEEESNRILQILKD